MKGFKNFIILFLVAIFISSCALKSLSGTYSTRNPKKIQSNTKALLYLDNDSTFYYIQLKGLCWCIPEYESSGKWHFNDSVIILNSDKQPSDTVEFSSTKNVNYKCFTNYSYFIKGRNLIDTSQTNTGLRKLRKISSETKN